MADGEVPGNNAGGNQPGGEEAAWRDLVARFDAPAPVPPDGAVPWPEREDLDGPVSVTPSLPPTLPDSLTREPPASPSGGPGTPGLPATPEQPWPRFGPGLGPRDTQAPDDIANEHYIPPPPPPLPKVDAVTKTAWVALFGGPFYLLIATAVGWNVSGLTAFLAVAAFVGGFAVLVVRMDSGGPRDSGPDDGAVV